MPQEFALTSEGFQTYAISIKPPGQGTGPERGEEVKHRRTETPFLMKRGGVFYEPPSFIEDDMFTTVVPVAPVESEVIGQVTPQVTPEVIGMLSVLKGAMDRRSSQVAMGLKAWKNFHLVYLRPALDAGLVEMTIPDKPRSSKRKYRLSDNGRQVLCRSEKRELK
jgi:hypothetical protein